MFFYHKGYNITLFTHLTLSKISLTTGIIAIQEVYRAIGNTNDIQISYILL